MVKAQKGTLVQCDEAIKTIITQLDSKDGNAYIIEDLDDDTVLVKPDKLPLLKSKLQAKLKDVTKEQSESDVDEDGDNFKPSSRRK